MRKILTLVTTAITLAAAPVVAQTYNWTGFYGGVELGYAHVDANPGPSDDGFIGGFLVGYDYDLGNNFVVGAGADLDFPDISLGALDVNKVFRGKVRGGVLIGPGLAYATGGYAWADTNIAGSDNGYFIGGGYEYRINQNFAFGTEVLYHDFGSFNNSGSDVDATTVQVRGIFRF
jgi:opacity protein-like surface antigen